MALEKNVAVDRIEVTDNGCVQVRVKTIIFENGQQISSTYRRHLVAPGDAYDKEDERVQAICKAMHTKEVVAAYRAKIVTPE